MLLDSIVLYLHQDHTTVQLGGKEQISVKELFLVTKKFLITQLDCSMILV
jgi:hypothetical protein